LPPGFTFIFKRDKPPRHITKRSYTAGLFISHSSYSIKTFRSIEAAVDCIPRLRNFNPNVIADFNRHIGVQTISNAIPSRRKRSPKAAPVPLSASAEEIPHGKACMTLKDLYDARCGICENCRKDDCGQCSSCMSTGSSSRRQVCIQKVNLRYAKAFIVEFHLYLMFSLSLRRCVARSPQTKRHSVLLAYQVVGVSILQSTSNRTEGM
jgi:hypothetical protein